MKCSWDYFADGRHVGWVMWWVGICTHRRLTSQLIYSSIWMTSIIRFDLRITSQWPYTLIVHCLWYSLCILHRHWMHRQYDLLASVYVMCLRHLIHPHKNIVSEWIWEAEILEEYALTQFEPKHPLWSSSWNRITNCMAPLWHIESSASSNKIRSARNCLGQLKARTKNSQKSCKTNRP